MKAYISETVGSNDFNISLGGVRRETLTEQLAINTVMDWIETDWVEQVVYTVYNNDKYQEFKLTPEEFIEQFEKAKSEYRLITAVPHVMAYKKDSEYVYNLNGIRLSQPPSRGLYIKNDKKFLSR